MLLTQIARCRIADRPESCHKGRDYKDLTSELDVLEHTTAFWEAETGESQVPGEPELHRVSPTTFLAHSRHSINACWIN